MFLQYLITPLKVMKDIPRDIWHWVNFKEKYQPTVNVRKEKKQGKSPTSKTSHPFIYQEWDLLHFHLKHCRVTMWLAVTSALLHTLKWHSHLETFNKCLIKVWHCSLRYLNAVKILNWEVPTKCDFPPQQVTLYAKYDFFLW